MWCNIMYSGERNVRYFGDLVGLSVNRSGGITQIISIRSYVVQVMCIFCRNVCKKVVSLLILSWFIIFISFC